MTYDKGVHIAWMPLKPSRAGSNATTASPSTRYSSNLNPSDGPWMAQSQNHESRNELFVYPGVPPIGPPGLTIASPSEMEKRAVFFLHIRDRRSRRMRASRYSSKHCSCADKRAKRGSSLGLIARSDLPLDARLLAWPWNSRGYRGSPNRRRSPLSSRTCGFPGPRDRLMSQGIVRAGWWDRQCGCSTTGPEFDWDEEEGDDDDGSFELSPASSSEQVFARTDRLFSSGILRVLPAEPTPQKHFARLRC